MRIVELIINGEDDTFIEAISVVENPAIEEDFVALNSQKKFEFAEQDAEKRKKIIINNGLVSNQLSKINPIIVPTNTAATNSVLNLKACPIFDVCGFSFSTFNFLRAFFRRSFSCSLPI